MISGHVQIERELAIRGWRRAFRFRGLWKLAYYNACELIVIWVVIAIANAIQHQGVLSIFHFEILAIFWVVATLACHIKWYLDIEKNTFGWAFDAILDENGVKVTRSESEKHYDWVSYKAYKEYEDYLEIEDIKGNVTFLPKTEDLAEVISFTKSKLRRKN